MVGMNMCKAYIGGQRLRYASNSVAENRVYPTGRAKGCKEGRSDAAVESVLFPNYSTMFLCAGEPMPSLSTSPASSVS